MKTKLLKLIPLLILTSCAAHNTTRVVDIDTLSPNDCGRDLDESNQETCADLIDNRIVSYVAYVSKDADEARQLLSSLSDTVLEGDACDRLQWHPGAKYWSLTHECEAEIIYQREIERGNIED